MWRALVAGMVFGHESAASLLRELGRNPALLGRRGFDPLGRQAPTRRTVERTADGGAAVVQLASPRRDGVPSEEDPATGGEPRHTRVVGEGGSEHTAEEAWRLVTTFRPAPAR